MVKKNVKAKMSNDKSDVGKIKELFSDRLSLIAKSVSENQIVIFLLLAAVLVRVLPVVVTGHLGNNFAPVGAMALFAGAYLKKRDSVWLPLAIMIASDAVIGFHNLIFFTWGSYLLIALIGQWLRSRKTVLNVSIAVVSGSLLFFFVTNFGVWAFTPLYVKTWQGLVECYVMGIPFFRNTLLSDLFYAGVLFGAFELSKAWVEKRKLAVEKI